MKTENISKEARVPGRGPWVGIALTMFVVAGLAFGGWRLWNKSDRTAQDVQPFASESVLIPVEGMACSVCASRVKKTLKEMPGVSEAVVNLEKHEAEVRYEPDKTSPEKLAKAIDALGYKAGSPRVKEKAR
ncbi:MAG: hypothetical protein ABS95_00590 [Verrucomicrobia bacterium SCN 57-15]|nr:MAG: hypothetical protein ABS95_00590 [Verrucomicrobia bacterium SCN 57-15]